MAFDSFIGFESRQKPRKAMIHRPICVFPDVCAISFGSLMEMRFEARVF